MRGFWGFGDDFNRSTCLFDCPPRPTFRIPRFPLPLLEMCETIYAQQRDRTVVLASVVRVEVYPDVPVEVAEGGVERLCSVRPGR